MCSATGASNNHAQALVDSFFSVRNHIFRHAMS
jgi:hypothetical protein